MHGLIEIDQILMGPNRFGTIISAEIDGYGAGEVSYRVGRSQLVHKIGSIISTTRGIEASQDSCRLSTTEFVAPLSVIQGVGKIVESRMKVERLLCEAASIDEASLALHKVGSIHGEFVRL